MVDCFRTPIEVLFAAFRSPRVAATSSAETASMHAAEGTYEQLVDKHTAAGSVVCVCHCHGVLSWHSATQSECGAKCGEERRRRCRERLAQDLALLPGSFRNSRAVCALQPRPGHGHGQRARCGR